ncbi:MAG TPA: amidase [Rhodopila sp.]|uniref:amidase n=1 Tax=Rhodopila sp. TaxID=2480087 RepID=UPI002B67C256|nr:amidase [Rhodopila sp.]HVY16552.1 amidase [Rhodopila sp.]
MTDVLSLTATQAARLIQDGRLRPEALMDAYLDHIARRDPSVLAFAHFDPAQAAAAAGAAKAGPLRGIPIGAKDVLDTADMPSQYGSPIWAGWQPKADSAPVAWARAAGGVIVGKTVTTEFATRAPGPTRNPVNPGHTPGGSSSGSAAGVGAGLFPLAYGTQTAGSVIRPAAFCGVVGYKPTFGTISRIGMKIMADSLDTIGVMARTVADCALFASAVSGRDLGDPDARPSSSPRIGICQSPAWSIAQPETRSLLERVATALGKAGAQVATRELPPLFNGLVDAHPIVMNAESARALGWELAHHADLLTEGLRERMGFGLSQTEAALRNAYDVFETTQRAFPDAMDGLDILVTPAAPGEAPKGLGWTGDPAFNSIWTSLHVPCVTVPAGSGPNGLPLGIQVVGRAGDDKAVLAWARWVEAAIA